MGGGSIRRSSSGIPLPSIENRADYVCGDQSDQEQEENSNLWKQGSRHNGASSVSEENNDEQDSHLEERDKASSNVRTIKVNGDAMRPQRPNLTPSPSNTSERRFVGRESLSPLTYRQQYNRTPDPYPATTDPNLANELLDATNRLDDYTLDSPALEDSFANLGLRVDDMQSDDEDNEIGDDSDRNIEDETLPKARFYTHRFQDALKALRKLLVDLSTTLETSPTVARSSSHLHDLLKKTQSLSTWESSATQRIALVGDAGSGKSSLINALLNKNGLAWSGSSGRACTCVITEYRYQDQRHKEPFRIEVEYMSSLEVTTLIKNYLRMYKLRHGPSFGDIVSREERDRIEHGAKLAWDTFSVIFSNQDFSENLLKEGDEAEVQTMLQNWAETAQAQLPRGEQGIWSDTATTKAECQRKLDKFVRTPVDSSEQALWPFVNIVRIFLHAQILKNGIVLADLPGLRDINQARLEATENYVYGSDEIFVVADIARAETNEGVEDVVQRFGSSKAVRIICTKSEMVIAKEEESACHGRDADDIRNLRHKQKKHQAMCSKVDAELRRRDLMPEHRAKLKINQKVFRDKLDKGKLDLKRKIMNTRNERVTENLEATHKTRIIDERLKVFCVSNTDYFEYLGNQAAYGKDYLDLSGIVDLREWCLSLVAEANFHAACSYITDVTSCLSSLKLWHSAGSGNFTMDIFRQLQEELNTVEKELRGSLVLQSSDLGKLESQTNQHFKDFISFMVRKSESWRSSSIQVAMSWHGVPWNTYQAYCRKWGIHTPKGQGPGNWNDELTRHMRKDLSPKWRELLDVQLDACHSNGFRVAETSIARASARIEDFGKAHGDVVFDSLWELIESMRLRTDQYIDIVDRAFEVLMRDISELERKTQTAQTTSYTCQTMIPTYNACARISGPGTQAQMRETMEAKVVDGNIHLEILTALKRKLKEIIKACFNQIRSQLDALVKDIGRDLDTVRDMEVVESDEDRDFTDRLGLALSNADEVMKACAQTVKEVREQPFRDGYVVRRESRRPARILDV